MATIYNNDWEIKNVKCILFDKDGTLLDGNIFWGSIIIHRANRIIKTYNISQNYFKQLCLTMGYSNKSRKLIPEGPVGIAPREFVIEKVVCFLNTLNLKIVNDEISKIFNEVHLEMIPLMNSIVKILPGVKALFKILKKYNIKIAIVTSDTELNTKLFLKINNIFNYVDLIIGRESTIEHKNTGIPAKIAVEKLRLDSNNIICIGDAPMDIIMANNANLLASIGVLTGQTTKEEMYMHTNYIIQNLISLQVRN